jgi:hypothetical protein
MRVLWDVFKFFFKLVLGIVSFIIAVALSFIPE